MTFAVRFFSASGAEANQVGKDGNLPIEDNFEPRQWIWPLTPANGGAASPSRIGFFGNEGHGDSVLLTTWNTTVFIVDKDGAKTAGGYGGDSGMFVPLRYESSTGVFMSGFNGNANGWSWSLTDAPLTCESGTLFIRFIEPSGLSVQTLNSTFRCVALDANDWVTDVNVGADNTYVHVQAVECSRAGGQFGFGDMDGNPGETWPSVSTGDVVWTKIDAGGSNNYISLMDHNWTQDTHDFVTALSITPLQTGKIINFGFMAIIEYV